MSVNSGITCSKDVRIYFKKLQEKREYRYVIYRIRTGPKSRFITLEKTGDRDNEFHDFVADLPKSEARYAVYDFSYITPDWGLKDGILFIFWTPYDTSQVEARTIYSSSKATILAELRDGASFKQIEVTDVADLNESYLMDALLPLREKGIDLNLGKME